jgi:hypothetical protein
MSKVLLRVGFIIVLAVGVMGMLSCAPPETPEQKYEKAKLEAEQKIAELEEIMIPLKAIEKGDFSALPTDPVELKRLSDKMKNADLRKMANDISQATLKVRQLMPPGYEDDYDQWTEEIEQRVESWSE